MCLEKATFSKWFLLYFFLDAHSSHGRSNFRDERSSKTYERLQKKLKDRQGTQKDKMSSPPSSPQKCPSPISEHNGLTKGQNASGTNTGSMKKSGKGKGGAQIDTEIEGNYLKYILIVFLSSFNLLKVYSPTFQSFHHASHKL